MKHLIQKIKYEATRYKVQAFGSYRASRQDGFTLIEIIVVTTIIGILAAGGFVSYSTLTQQSRDARRKGDLEQVRAAVEQYRSNVGTYPATITSGSPIVDSDTGTIYMSKVPTDPNPKYSYYFTVTSNGTNYSFCSYLESVGNGSDGNQDPPTGGGPSSGGLGQDVLGASVITCGGSTNCNYCVGPYGEE